MATPALPSITPETSLARYLQEIRKFPMLEVGEEYMLAKRWVDHEDTAAANQGLPEAARSVLSSFARQALHAYVLGFSHPLSHEPLSFECPLPIDMKQLMSTLETL